MAYTNMCNSFGLGKLVSYQKLNKMADNDKYLNDYKGTIEYGQYKGKEEEERRITTSKVIKAVMIMGESGADVKMGLAIGSESVTLTTRIAIGGVLTDNFIVNVRDWDINIANNTFQASGEMNSPDFTYDWIAFQ